MPKETPAAYTEEELVMLLKDRQAGMTQMELAADIGISFQMLSDIFRGTRSVGCDKVLAYLAPRGRKFVEEKVWHLVKQ